MGVLAGEYSTVLHGDQATAGRDRIKGVAVLGMVFSMSSDGLHRARFEAKNRGDAPLQFSLGTLLVVITLIAACLGLTMAVPPLGLPVSFIALGGLVRTLVIGKQHQRLGVPFPLGEKITEFIVSCGVVVGATMVGMLTLFGTCCLAGLAAAGWDQIQRGFAPQTFFDLVGFVLSIAALLVVVLAPVCTTTWFLWATRPR
jgi:hypothetical protein